MSVSHLKISHAEVVPGLIVVPSSSSLLPLLPSDLPNLQQQLIEQVNLSMHCFSFST